MAKREDPNAFLQLMYEQNSELDDVERLQDTAIATPDAKVPAEPGLGQATPATPAPDAPQP